MQPHPEHLLSNQRKWDRRAATYEDRRFDYFRIVQRMLLSMVPAAGEARILDVGCGTGWAVRRAAGRLSKGGMCVGLDLSEGMARQAVRRSAGLANARFGRANAEEIPLRGEYFHAVLCSFSFHHYVRPGKTLQEIRRVLMPQGRVYILDVTADDPFTRFLDGRVRRNEKEHVRFYGTAEYRAMFAAAGLRHVRSRLLYFLYPLKVHIGEKMD